jgi:hypothetical protein
MSNNPSLNPFRNPNGSTSYQGQQNAGTWQAASGQPLSGQQSWESATAFATRQGAYMDVKGKQGS